MKHAIEVLQEEHRRLTSVHNAAISGGRPKNQRPSEWAMYVSSLQLKRQQIFEAIQVLSKVGRD